MKIGIAGTGRMGAAMAARLASVGHGMMVWNRNADKARATGFEVADSPQALAAGCEAVISMLTDAAAVKAVYGQMLSARVAGKLFIGMSTNRPAGGAEALPMVKKKQAAFVE